jgi:hypothetical protein
MPGGFCLHQLSLGGRYLGRARAAFGAGLQGRRFHLGLLGLLRLQRRGATKRGVSEVEQLSLSMCMQTSGDAMSCISRHNPHYTPKPQKRAEFYSKKCLACHTGATFATTQHPGNPDRNSCHMPRTSAENIPHPAWADYRILKSPEASEPTANLSAGDKLVSSSPRVQRDASGARLLQKLLEGNFTLQQKGL